MGAKRAVPLPVSAPFHCPLMQPAAEAMRDALSYVVVEAPAVPLYANVTAAPETDPDTIRTLLVEQVTGMVRWRESVANMADGGRRGVRRTGRQGARPDGQAHRAGREGDERRHDRGHRSAGEGDRMMFDLSGMTALVTGASGRAGHGDRQGAGGAGRAAGGVGQQCRQARELSARASAATMSRCRAICRTARRSTQLVPQAVEALGGKLDILVNNAGITRDNLLMRMKDEELDEVIRINLEAAFRLMRAAARPMMKARFGRIISVTSVVGVTGNPGQANYVAVEGRADRHDQGGRAGAREPRDHRQLHRAGLHDLGDDRRAQRPAARRRSCRGFRWARWAAARTSARRRSISPAARPATSPARRCTSTAGWRCSERAPARSGRCLAHSLSSASAPPISPAKSMFRLPEGAEGRMKREELWPRSSASTWAPPTAASQ